MNLNITWINLLILFGALQALIFSFILLFNRKHPGAKFLAAFIFVMAYNGFETFNWSAGLNLVFFEVFSFIVVFALGPSLYLYIRSLLEPEQKLATKILLIHYSVVIFQLATRIALLTYHILWINKIIEVEITSTQLISTLWTYYEPFSILAFFGYLGASIYLFSTSKRKGIKSISRDTQQTVISWIKTLLVCMVVLGIAWPLTVIAPQILNVSFDEHYYPIELALVFFTYWVVLTGYHKMKVIERKPASLIMQMGEAEHRKLFEKLKHAVEHEKLYLDAALNLTKVSLHIGVPAKTISFVLNQYNQINFNDFINSYRVAEVKAKMIDPANQHYTITGLALSSGFNSQATFQRAFKANTNMSPREYLNQQQKKTA